MAKVVDDVCPRCQKPQRAVSVEGEGNYALVIRDCCGDVFALTEEGPAPLRLAHLVSAHLSDPEGFDSFVMKLGIVHLHLLLEKLTEEKIRNNGNANQQPH